MMTDAIQLAAATAGTIISLPIALAAGRAFFFFGRLDSTIGSIDKAVETARTEIKQVVEQMDHFVRATDSRLNEADVRLARIEAARETEELYGRRSTDIRKSLG